MGQPGILASALLSVAMVGVVALLWGAWRMAFRQGNKPKGALMLVAALVLLGNVLILTI
jgi:hypothetical protein